MGSMSPVKRTPLTDPKTARTRASVPPRRTRQRSPEKTRNQKSRSRKDSITEMTVMLSFLLLLFWFLVFSGLRWRVRLGGTLALVLAVLGSVKGVRFTGDMEPIFQFRWERTHDEIL